MDSIDALGSRPERRGAFTRELLMETQDAELQSIVESAAKSLDTPISLVTLVLDHVQFFKAHYGLPPDLVAARGTSRDVSFCQFVVRDEKPFEVTHAADDERVPQHLVREYGIQAYLGVPIHAQDTVAGSLCVIDTKPRSFSETERDELAKLAKRVNERLAKLTESRRQARLSLAESASVPALAELQRTLTPIRAATDAGLLAVTALSSFHRLASHAFGGGSSPPEAMKQSLKAAEEALEECENLFYDIETSLDDAEDSLLALEHLSSPTHSTRLSEVLTAAQELSRHALRPVGGTALPDLASDPEIYTPRALATSLLATSLGSIAARLTSQGSSGGIKIAVDASGSTAQVALSARELPATELEPIATELNQHLGEESTVTVSASDEALRIAFQVVRESD